MNRDEVPEENKRLRAGREQTRRFARLNLESKRAFFELHAYLMVYLYRLWIVEYDKSRPMMPNFNSILNLVRIELHNMLG